MIKVEGYKAFRGVMRITPKNPEIPPKEIYSDWLYKPDSKCWYGSGKSFSEEICEVLEDIMERNKISDSKRYSIITNDMNRCYVCGSVANTELHEIFFGSKRELSKSYGLVVPVCENCHRGTNGVHGKNGHELDIRLKTIGEKKFKKYYPELDFIKIFGKGGYEWKSN